MSSEPTHVCVCVCTFRRPMLLRRLLDCLKRQQTNNEFSYSIVVTDNDSQFSAQPVVNDFAANSAIETTYSTESRQNIALARNKAVEQARGEFIAFIDDDEFPEPDWLRNMLRACEVYEAAGILGPVRPHFEEPPPRWIIKGGLCERPEYDTGWVMDCKECRTGNLLFRRSILDGVPGPFRAEFSDGGEDIDFFMRMTQRGHVFRWCNEGITYETVPKARLKRTYMLRRAMLRGKNILKLPTGRVALVARSVVAAPAYLLILPVTLLFGQHVFMKYCIKFCDHAGRVLALLGLNPVRER